jgi:hypothetical protein
VGNQELLEKVKVYLKYYWGLEADRDVFYGTGEQGDGIIRMEYPKKKVVIIKTYVNAQGQCYHGYDAHKKKVFRCYSLSGFARRVAKRLEQSFHHEALQQAEIKECK